MKNFITKYKSELATALGCIVALANAWATIDWANFQFTKGNIMQLVISGIIALGGIFSSLNVSSNQPTNPTPNV